MALGALFSVAKRLLGEQRRHSWINRNRAHIEYRTLHRDEYSAFVKAVRDQVSELPQGRWVEVNPYTRRVVIAFDDHAYDLSSLVGIVEEAERACDLHDSPFYDDGSHHPSDADAHERVALELATDVVGFLMGSGLWLSPFKPSRLAGSGVALISIVRGSERLRRGLDDRYGAERSDLALGMLMALFQGLAQRPASSMVEIVQNVTLLREAQARRRLWEARESELCREPVEYLADTVRIEPRPVPLPNGPIEEYADRAWVVSLAGFGVSFLTTRNFQRATAALFGGLPKPARMGRDVFAAELGRHLAKKGVLVRDPQALRRLDRIDCLVLEGNLVARDRFEVGQVRTLDGLDPGEVRLQALQLFDPEQPLELRRASGYTLGPLKRLSAEPDAELSAHADTLAVSGGLVLGLMQDRVLAVVEVRIIPQTGIDELIAAAHDARMRVVIASNDESVLQGLPADDTIPEGPGMRAGIRRLQREGRIVCVVGSGSSSALHDADCGIGLVSGDVPTPWGAHIICRQDLSDVRFLIHACTTARQVSKQSVHIALGAATVGALVSAGGLVPMTTRRVIFVVNAASLIAMILGARRSSRLARRPLPRPRDRTPWHALDPRGALSHLKATERGLTVLEASQRARSEAAPPSAVAELAEAVTDELFSPLAPLLAAGAGLSAVVGSLGDAGMVGGVVVLNALVGGVQRFRTERAIRSLARHTQRRARVRRAGRVAEIDAAKLVLGDVVELGAGDVVPADCRIIEAESVEVDASSLTGESLPVKKGPLPSFEAQIADRSSMLYEGTSLASGYAVAVVVATGEDTEARRGGAASPQDPLRGGVERRLRGLIDLTGPVALVAGVGLVTAGLLRGRKLEELVGAGVSLAVASVPEGLPLLATAAQLAAADRLSKRGALVRNARSIEALGRVDILCVDKTGTVTQGKIELSVVTDIDVEQSLDDLSGARVRALAAALRATPDPRHSLAQRDPTDGALVRAAARSALRPDYGYTGWQRKSEVSFESGRSFHAVLGSSDAGDVLSVKGAPEVVLRACSRRLAEGHALALDAETLTALELRASNLARRGLRVLAVAERSVLSEDRLDPDRLVGLTFLGFLAFSDPVRPSAASAIAQLRAAGVETAMITGDHPSTAHAIAKELDLLRDKRVLTGADLIDLSDDELDRIVGKVSVFARVTPSQKVRIVRSLQRVGRVVAMVGDGANDAPAIRLANVGIAIGEQSTSAARSAADIVLTDERIETLVHALAEGRAMWASVRDAVSILVGGNLGEIGFTLAGGLIDGKSPLNARQLLLVNLLTDVAPAMAIALRPPSLDTLEALRHEGPEASLGLPLTRAIAARALTTSFGAGAAWIFARALSGHERASTVGLLALVGTQLAQTLSSGGLTRPVVLTSVLSTAVLAAIVQTPGLSQVFGCRPLGPIGWATASGATVLAISLSRFAPELVDELRKMAGLDHQEPNPEALVAQTEVRLIEPA